MGEEKEENGGGKEKRRVREGRIEINREGEEM